MQHSRKPLQIPKSQNLAEVIMHPELLELICCPVCHTSLHVETPLNEDGVVWDGTLSCQAAHTFPIVNGLPYLYVNDERWQSKAREVEGWVALHKKKQIYTPQEKDSVDYKIPYFAEPPWLDIAHAFDLALDILNLTGDEVVLDIGAGRGWAAKQFAKRGCRVVALDIVPDENIGLGRAWAIMKEAHVHFDLTIGDGENLPFLPNSFDIVYCSATLHHAADLPLFLQNIQRVLKPHGRLCATSEPCISIWRDEAQMLQTHSAEELELGINETLPPLSRYEAACAAAGLTVQEAFPSNVYPTEGQTWATIGRDLGATWGGYTLSDPLASATGLAQFLMRRTLGLVKGASPPAAAQTLTAEQKIQREILTWCGGELFLLATK